MSKNYVLLYSVDGHQPVLIAIANRNCFIKFVNAYILHAQTQNGQNYGEIQNAPNPWLSFELPTPILIHIYWCHYEM